MDFLSFSKISDVLERYDDVLAIHHQYTSSPTTQSSPIRPSTELQKKDTFYLGFCLLKKNKTIYNHFLKWHNHKDTILLYIIYIP